ncbi:MAG: F0F1 ATP synthase subunit gamma [Bacteroidaceae bacterium]|nr:F0F1 ATP synthase subunit gamma [Bacteroidaceae bacterium]
MGSLKEIKGRIASVQSTRKITSAMKMVASSKLHHAQTMIENMLPYEGMLEKILKTFLASEVEAQSSITQAREVRRAGLIVFASNSSLCGGFNANVLKLMERQVRQYQERGIEVVVYPIGRKVSEKVAKLGLTSAGNFTELADKPNATDCQEIGRTLGEQFVSGEIDEVKLIYHHFKSAGSQILQCKMLMPIDIAEAMDYDHDRDLSTVLATKQTQEYLQNKEKSQSGSKAENVAALNDNFLVEPDMQTVLHALIPRYVNLMIYTALLDSNASEHAARMVAMQTATDNADELLRMLNLQYNKQRQYAITAELLDIVGGSMQ